MQDLPISLINSTYEIKCCPLCNSKNSKFYKYFYKSVFICAQDAIFYQLLSVITKHLKMANKEISLNLINVIIIF